MQPLVLASGTQTATLTTEHTLATITIPGSYALVVDTAALANGETLTVRRKTKVLVGGTQREEEVAVYVHAQGVPIHRFEVAPSDVEVVFTLRQDGGTGRAFPWKVLGLTGFDVLAVGTAQGGAAGTIQLAAATSFADDLINGVIAAIIGGTGAGQQRVGYDWASATDTLTVSPSWGTNPDATSQYVIFRAPPAVTASGSLPKVDVGAIDGSATEAANLKTAFGTTIAEVASVPAANAPIWTAIKWLLALARNKMTQTATTKTLRNDADSGNIATSTVSDDGSTYTRGEWS